MWFLGACLALAGAGPEAPVQNSEVGPLRVALMCPAGPIGLSEAFSVRVTLTGPERVAVGPPGWTAGQELPGAKVLAVHPEGPDKLVGQFGTLVARSWKFRFEPLALGKLTLPPLPFKYRDGMEPEQAGAVRLPTLEIVAEHTASGDLAQLKSPHFDPEPPAVDSGATVRVWMIAGGAALLALALAGLFARSAAPVVVPAEACRQALAAAEALPVPRDRLHAAAAALRGYLATRYGVPAERLTAPELAADLPALAILSKPQRAALDDFFRAADDRRFPAPGPTSADAAGVLSRARAFLGGETPMGGETPAGGETSS